MTHGQPMIGTIYPEQRELIPVAQPALTGNETKYVLDCLRSSWISSTGEYVRRFEAEFAAFCGVPHAVSCCNGTAALHLALAALGVTAGDEVIVPALTYIATANAVTYCGGRPVFVDSEPEGWNIDPEKIERAITPHTKGIIVVHLYGNPADMDPIMELAHRHGLFVVEDAAEAHGAEYLEHKIGSIGDAATFSFYGNKIVTTGEGGMVTVQSDRLAQQVRLLRGQGVDPHRQYWHPVIGYNYRMTNIAAAIGVAQLERVQWHLKKRLEVANWYREELSETSRITWQHPRPGNRHVFWMFTILIDGVRTADRDTVMARLKRAGIETRPVFYPIHTLPPYASADNYSCPVAEQISTRGINLPTWAGLTKDDVHCICDALAQSLEP